MVIIEVNNNGTLLIMGLNVMSQKMKDDQEYQVKFNIKRSEKFGITVSKVILGETKGDQKPDKKS